MVNLLHRVLKLAVQHITVGDNDHAVKHRVAVIFAQFHQVMGRPGNGAGLAGTCAVVTQVGHACAIFASIGQHLVHCRPLVKARENQGFFLRPVTLNIHHVLFLDVDKTMENPQPGIRLADRLPEVGYRVFLGTIGLNLTWRVTRMYRATFVLAPLIERQEKGVFSIQLGRHHDFRVGHGEMYHRPTLEGQQWLSAFGLGVIRQAIIAVLIHGRFAGLGEVGLQFDGCHRQTVDKQHQINGKFTGRVILQLRHHAQDIGLVALNDCCIALVFRCGLGHLDQAATGNGKALAQHLHGALFLQCFIQAIHQHFKGFGPVEPFQLVPFFLLAAGFDPAFQVFGVHRPLGVVEPGITQLPALFYQPVDDILLEVFFMMCC